TMTATPHGRNPEDLWGQMMIVDGGETLGQTLGLFREVFFNKQKSFFGRDNKWEFRTSRTRLLTQIMNNRSIRFEAAEADLPRVSEIVKACTLPEDAEQYYNRALETLRKAGKGNFREMKN